MKQPSGPPFRADHVGSLLRPRRLSETRSAWQRGELTENELEAVENECILQAVRMQESVGLRGITDGDFRRDDWIMDFMLGFDGLEAGENYFEVKFSGNLTYRAPIAKMIDRVRCPQGGIMVEDFEFLKAATTQTAKLCIPAPSMFYTIVQPATIDPAIYPEPEEFWADLAGAYGDAIAAFGRAGCTYLQIDDVNSATLADSNRRAFWRSLGHEPPERLDSFIRLNNAAVRSRPQAMTLVVHMCRGNFQSQWSGEGSYEMIAERYFSESDVDGFFLEYDDRRSGGFEPLRYMPKDKVVVLGIMTSKGPELEAKDQLKRRIDAAAKYVPLDNLCISPQCGFASTREGNRLAEHQQRRKLAHLVEVAQEVWGTTLREPT